LSGHDLVAAYLSRFSIHFWFRLSGGSSSHCPV
jgi:hypothetical protein